MSASLLAVLTMFLSAPQEEPTPPEPTKYHQYLKQFEGDWDAVMKFMTEPGQPMSGAKGSEKNRLSPGGLWLVMEYKGTLFGSKYAGRGVMGYDTNKEKFVGTWTDTLSTQVHISEGTCDEDGKKFTMSYTTPDPQTGEPMVMKYVSEILDNDRKRISFIVPVPGGEDLVMGTIEYTRKAKGKNKKKKDKLPKKPE